MSNPALTSDDWQELRRILEDVAQLEDLHGVPSRLASDAGHLLPKLASRERAVEVRRSSRPPRNESVSSMRRRVRAEVKDRAQGRCEYRCPSTGKRCTTGGVIGDHFWGRGRDDTVEGVWLLCVTHDREKTRYDGGRYVWIMSFREHCLALSYEEQAAKCERAAALERAQHPEHLNAAKG